MTDGWTSAMFTSNKFQTSKLSPRKPGDSGQGAQKEVRRKPISPRKALLVSVIVPCRNEENFIGQCLDSILRNDFPHEHLEILAVDGMSDDNTRDIIEDYAARHKFIKLYDNPQKIVPSALNIGINRARGEIVMRMDAHNIYPEDYISKCVEYLNEYSADNVGGIWITLPGSDSAVAKAIALAVAHPFAAGNAYYRIGSKQPRYVDTVPFGCYRREIFERIGMFDEELIRNQDDEFNLRLIRNGGRILLAPDIISCYFARSSLRKLWKMYFQYGYFKPLVAKKIGGILTLRQLVPAAFVMSLVLLPLLSLLATPFLHAFVVMVAIYLLANLFCSSRIALKSGFRHVILPLVFSTIHTAYGCGYLKGIADFILLGNIRKKNLTDISLTR